MRDQRHRGNVIVRRDGRKRVGHKSCEMSTLADICAGTPLDTASGTNIQLLVPWAGVG